MLELEQRHELLKLGLVQVPRLDIVVEAIARGECQLNGEIWEGFG